MRIARTTNRYDCCSTLSHCTNTDQSKLSGNYGPNSSNDQSWFYLAWAFLMCMAEAPNIDPIMAAIFMQSIAFFFIQIIINSKTSHLLFICSQINQEKLLSQGSKIILLQTIMQNQERTTTFQNEDEYKTGNTHNCFDTLLKGWLLCQTWHLLNLPPSCFNPTSLPN